MEVNREKKKKKRPCDVAAAVCFTEASTTYFPVLTVSPRDSERPCLNAKNRSRWPLEQKLCQSGSSPRAKAPTHTPQRLEVVTCAAAPFCSVRPPLFPIFPVGIQHYLRRRRSLLPSLLSHYHSHHGPPAYAPPDCNHRNRRQHRHHHSHR